MSRDNIRIEGIRKTTHGWAVVGSRPGTSIVPGRSPRIIVLVDEFSGAGAKARAIRAAGTNHVVKTTAEVLIAGLKEAV